MRDGSSPGENRPRPGNPDRGRMSRAEVQGLLGELADVVASLRRDEATLQEMFAPPPPARIDRPPFARMFLGHARRVLTRHLAEQLAAARRAYAAWYADLAVVALTAAVSGAEVSPKRAAAPSPCWIDSEGELRGGGTAGSIFDAREDGISPPEQMRRLLWGDGWIRHSCPELPDAIALAVLLGRASTVEPGMAAEVVRMRLVIARTVDALQVLQAIRAEHGEDALPDALARRCESLQGEAGGLTDHLVAFGDAVARCLPAIRDNRRAPPPDAPDHAAASCHREVPCAGCSRPSP